MKSILAELLKSTNTALDVEDELQFHLEMLERKYIREGMPAAEAKSAALSRFGDLERVMKQCVAIRRRTSIRRRILKTLTILLALTGISIRLLSSTVNVDHLGDVLVMIAITGRLLLYVRGLSPSTFIPQTEQTRLSVVSKTPKTARN